MEAERALGLLALARKGGNIQLGEENTGAACRAGHARLILVAQDAADNAFRRARSFSGGGRIPFLRVPFGKEALGRACGRAMAALTDVSLALAFVKALEQPERHEALLADLETRVLRVQKRRQEERAHRNNVKHGKK